jgi:guanylate cyclase
VGKLFYNIDVEIEVLSEKQEMDLTHVVFQLHFENTQFKKISTTLGASDHHFQEIGSNLPIRSEIFFELFPFHVVFKRDLEIISVGESLRQAMKHAECESIRDVFNLIRPLMNLTWDNVRDIFEFNFEFNILIIKVMGHTNNVFELTTIEPVRRPESPTNGSPVKTNSIYTVF